MRKLILFIAIALALLVSAFFIESPLRDTPAMPEVTELSDIPAEVTETVNPQITEAELTPEKVPEPEPVIAPEPAPAPAPEVSEVTPEPTPKAEETAPVTPQTAPEPEVKPEPEPEKAHGPACTISIRCDTVFNHLDSLSDEKREIIPANGIILAPTSVTFNAGETVFDVLLRITREHKIHMEYSSSQLYRNSYIEGLANIYEFDCGELSGWLYKVNGEFPTFGASDCVLSDGDVIEWIYSCERGKDI